MTGQNAAGIHDPHDQSPRALRCGFLNTQLGNVQIGLASGQPKLPQTPLAAPINDALRGFCGELVGGVSEKEKVRSADLHAMLQVSPESYREAVLPLQVLRWPGS